MRIAAIIFIALVFSLALSLVVGAILGGIDDE